MPSYRFIKSAREFFTKKSSSLLKFEYFREKGRFFGAANVRIFRFHWHLKNYNLILYILWSQFAYTKSILFTKYIIYINMHVNLSTFADHSWSVLWMGKTCVNYLAQQEIEKNEWSQELKNRELVQNRDFIHILHTTLFQLRSRRHIEFKNSRKRCTKIFRKCI